MANLTGTRRRTPAVQRNGKQKDGTRPIVDYPQQGEAIAPSDYTIRIAAPAGNHVEVSIDGSEWQSCRMAAGYYWFDWHSPSKGTHTIVVRSKSAEGRAVKSFPRTCRAE